MMAVMMLPSLAPTVPLVVSLARRSASDAGFARATAPLFASRDLLSLVRFQPRR
jgi:hypothetical protein